MLQKPIKIHDDGKQYGWYANVDIQMGLAVGMRPLLNASLVNMLGAKAKHFRDLMLNNTPSSRNCATTNQQRKEETRVVDWTIKCPPVPQAKARASSRSTICAVVASKAFILRFRRKLIEHSSDISTSARSNATYGCWCLTCSSRGCADKLWIKLSQEQWPSIIRNRSIPKQR